MKSLLVILIAMGIGTSALAQSWVQLVNDSSHLLKYSPDPSGLRPEDAALAGTAVVSPTSPNNTWMMELWGNPSATAWPGELRLLPGSTFPAGSPVAGRFNAWNLLLPNEYPGGPASAPVFATFQIRLWEKTENDYESYADAALSGLAYTAITPIFTMNPGPATPNSMVYPLSPSFSTWAAGSLYTSRSIPEPASAFLLGLGLGSLLIFRRSMGVGNQHRIC